MAAALDERQEAVTHALGLEVHPTAVHRILTSASARAVKRGKFELLRLHDPGAKVPRAEQRVIVAAFAALTDALCRADTQCYWMTRPRYLKELTELWTVFIDGRLVGFSGLRLLRLHEGNVLYIDTLNVKPRALAYRFGNYSLGTVFVHEIFTSYYLRLLEPVPFAFRTQNPHVYKLARSILPDGVHPPLGAHVPRDPERGAALAAALARRLCPGKVFDPSSSVVRAALGRSLYGEASSAMRATDVLISRYFKQHVQIDAGDALVVVAMPTAVEAAALAAHYVATVIKDSAQRALPSVVKRAPAAREG